MHVVNQSPRLKAGIANQPKASASACTKSISAQFTPLHSIPNSNSVRLMDVSNMGPIARTLGGRSTYIYTVLFAKWKFSIK
mmetsp:Transcript_7888/g.12628  ORF Transcript_7888/g.12628 Transcript_7888/m.12628 type:complete len:81 (-) Transcript_7888:247-489(-)